MKRLNVTAHTHVTISNLRRNCPQHQYLKKRNLGMSVVREAVQLEILPFFKFIIKVATIEAKTKKNSSVWRNFYVNITQLCIEIKYKSKNVVLFSANIGGLLGLFMGFSIFSIIEIAYFILIRPYCNCMRDAERRRQTIQRGFSRFNNIKSRRMNSKVVSSRGMNNIIFPH